jgi:hypothetical protein
LWPADWQSASEELLIHEVCPVSPCILRRNFWCYLTNIEWTNGWMGEWWMAQATACCSEVWFRAGQYKSQQRNGLESLFDFGFPPIDPCKSTDSIEHICWQTS